MVTLKKVFNEYVIIKKDDGVKQIGEIELLQEINKPQSGVVINSFDLEQFPVGMRLAHTRNAAQPIVLEGEELGFIRKVDIICEL